MLELLAGAALRSLLLAAAVGMGLRLRRTHNPSVSLAAWTLVLAASLVMPAAMRLTTIALPHDMIPVARLPLAPLVVDWPGSPVSSAEAILSSTVSTAWPSWNETASLLYVAVFGVLLLRLLTGLSLSWRIVRQAAPIHEAWAEGFDVRTSRHLNAPVTFGSVILLPDDHTGWTPAMRSAVIAHEGAHVSRRDFAIQLTASANCMVFWFNPFSWWLRRHLRDLAEFASDDAAIAHLGDRLAYADILLEISESVSRLQGVVSMARPASVAARIRRILSEPPLTEGTSRYGRAMLAMGIVPLAALLSTLMILPSPPPARPPLSGDPRASVTRLADMGATEAIPRPIPPLTPANPAAAPVTMTAPPPSVVTEPTSTPSAAVPPPASAPRTETVAPLPPFPPMALPPSAAVARGTPRRAPSPITGNTLIASSSATVRKPNRTAKSQRTSDLSPGSQSNKSVRVLSQLMNRPEPEAGVTGEDGWSPLFKTVANETCTGNYSGAVGGVFPIPARIYSPVEAHFYRGPGDAPWVTFYFPRQQPANLPVTIRGGEIKFAVANGTTYTLSPSRNFLLPTRYHRLIGSSESRPDGTIDLVCRKSNHLLRMFAENEHHA